MILLEDLRRRPIGRDTILRYVECDRAQDLRGLTDRIDAPVLVVAGEDDGLTGPVQARMVTGAIPGARLELIPECGHSPQVERPAEFARLVASFLKR